MLRVPPQRQPDPVTCLPACVWSVLQYVGQSVSYDEIEVACRLGRYGALDDLAIQGLMEAGWDVEVVQQFDPEFLRAAIEDERPLILTLTTGHAGLHGFAHAVVLCDLTEDMLTVMDPLYGDYRTLAFAEASVRFAAGFRGFFICGTAPATAASNPE